jgi:hypothetical protein
MSGEEYLARKYCEPRAYWHCLHGFSGGNYYTYIEINFPEYWLAAVGKYIGHKPSAAAKQLHRRVEAARAGFRTKQERIHGNRKVSETEGLEDIYRREDKAWDAFNAQKQVYLKEYLKAKETGIVVRWRRTWRKCKQCREEKVTGRAKYCQMCAKRRHREAVRVNKKQIRSLGVISLPLQSPQPEPLAIA